MKTAMPILRAVDSTSALLPWVSASGQTTWYLWSLKTCSLDAVLMSASMSPAQPCELWPRCPAVSERSGGPVLWAAPGSS